MPSKVAIAIGAHPDDIEFYMAGTLLMLKKAGYEIHYLTVANGNCGSVEYNAAMTRSIRNAEARAAAKILGAHFHPSLTNDLEILYNLDLLRALAAVIREVKPGIVLTHSPQDYMEDHMNTSRLAVSAGVHARHAELQDGAAPPDGGLRCDDLSRAAARSLRPVAAAHHSRRVREHDSPVHKTQLKALAAHKSQQNWLDVSQGLNSYLLAWRDMSLAVGRLSKKFKHAEGWRRHLHFGYCGAGGRPAGRGARKELPGEQSL